LINRKIAPIVLMLFVMCSSTFAQVKVSTGTLKESRRTDGFFNDLDVEIKIAGLAGAKAVRVTVERAQDDTGKNLVSEKSVQKDYKEIDSSDTETTVEITLKSSERRATRVQEVTGFIEVFAPGSDPRASVTVPNFQRDIGKPLTLPALKAAGIEVTVWNKPMFEARKKEEEERLKREIEAKKQKAEKSGDLGDAAEVLGDSLVAIFGSLFNSFASMDENDIAFNVKDPQSKLVGIEMQDAAGQKLGRSSKMTIGGDPKTIICGLEKKAPPAARVKFYILTPKAVSKVPFKLSNLTLP